jgi:hypothetical protein
MFRKRGHVLYIMYRIEFQTHGLPHGHILVKFANDMLSTADIDEIISAELPDNEADRLLISRLMIHYHPSSYCQYKDPLGNIQCCFRYPHPVQAITTIDEIGRVHYRRRHPQDAMVIPYNLSLLRAFDCHINFEVAATSHLFQYLFKYIHKGPFLLNLM